MKFSLRLDEVILDIEADEDIYDCIKNTFKGFCNIEDYSSLSDINVKINNNFEALDKNAIDFKESYRNFNSKIKIDNKVEVWLNEKDSRANQVELCQMLVCNIYAKLFENKGYYFLHCSAVSKNGKAIIVCGEKNTGKTVNLLNLLQNGYSFITNDMLMIKLSNDKLICHGMPYHIGIRLSKNWLDKPENKKYLDFAKSRNFVINTQNPTADENKLFISPKRLTRLNNTTIEHTAEISCILNTIYDKNSNKLNCQKLSKKELLNLLLSQKLNAVHHSKSFLNNIKADIDYSKTNAILEKLCNTKAIKIYENENSYTDIQLFSDLFVEDEEQTF